MDKKNQEEIKNLFLIKNGYNHGLHFEDDEIQIEIIKNIIPNIKIIHIHQNILTKENVRHL